MNEISMIDFYHALPSMPLRFRAGVVVDGAHGGDAQAEREAASTCAWASAGIRRMPCRRQGAYGTAKCEHETY